MNSMIAEHDAEVRVRCPERDVVDAVRVKEVSLGCRKITSSQVGSDRMQFHKIAADFPKLSGGPS